MTPDEQTKALSLVEWTKKKIQVCQVDTKDVYYDAGQVWQAHVGENVGSEQNGTGPGHSRPVLIIKKAGPKIVWAVPLTSKAPETPWLMPLTTHKPGSAVISQIKAFSPKRLIRLVQQADEKEFEEIKKQIRRLLE